ncbi:hypothetical protein E4198_02740 [Streptomyces sp. RKND-216]|uniref:DUF6278 family protein n=1 Tax=Streptomyces sp. RKND-216 TaxID=2562581 RepID=UPI00109DCABE|nr:DUF6278 family protein [Streptomyces sp. RKND-216]THA23787.1 hypothetical protein E4198_02740 [Streptomyces sp. RKND-216]
MHIPFLEHWRRRHGDAPHGTGFANALSDDPEGVAEVLSECELLRDHAERAGVELDDSAESLAALDQLFPLWRDDTEAANWLGSDAGLYLGTVLVRTVPGSSWQLWETGQPIVRLPSGLEVDVLEEGRAWAATGTPELAQLYAELSDD